MSRRSGCARQGRGARLRSPHAGQRARPRHCGQPPRPSPGQALPPGTSKWNKIEHRLFSFISQNWRAKLLVSYRVIVELISATTKTGLTVRCELDPGQYPSGIVVSDAEMAAINIKRAEFHGEWNYTISPKAYSPNCAFVS
jgi:DDE family transposase